MNVFHYIKIIFVAYSINSEFCWRNIYSIAINYEDFETYNWPS
jgi:hypothetical protein